MHQFKSELIERSVCQISNGSLSVCDDLGFLNMDATNFYSDCVSIHLSAEDEEKLRVLLNKRKESKE